MVLTYTVTVTFQSLYRYGSHFNVDRILYGVATLRNIVNGLLRTLTIENLIDFFLNGVAAASNTFNGLSTGCC